MIEEIGSKVAEGGGREEEILCTSLSTQSATEFQAWSWIESGAGTIQLRIFFYNQMDFKNI